jgi:acetyl-CoA carboxylase carboxyltransferase component
MQKYLSWDLASFHKSCRKCQSTLCQNSFMERSLIDIRDPSQHSKLQEAIEHQSTALYSTARLWDDGIIRPTDTRSALELALALSSREHPVVDVKGSNKHGYGVFRM